ncbi:MFS transporter [Candidatus Colwellia aromaticivorans]|uniref:MFS transporter n=1 Tax=Candidatus Colwellia aromaticivorans TaxID=2267621 RepID=UPI000DF18960|nr:MFS transporter [Candidatus Colwellia aromaticivorans]
MSIQEHYETASKDKISLIKKIIYGFGAFVNNLLGAAIGTMTIVLNLGLGMSPALVGLLGALPRLVDAFTDPLMGYISDNTKSKWGRRRPYLFIGAIIAGIAFALLWQLPRDQSESFYFWFFLIGSVIFYLAYTVFATPWVALGYELTPDYHERTRIMAVQNFMGQFAWLFAPWFLLFMQNESLFSDMIEGASWLAIIIGLFTVFVGVLPAIFLTERFTPIPTQKEGVDSTAKPIKSKKISEAANDFFKGFLITLKFKPFLSLCAATFLVFNGFMMVSAFQSYVIIYYVFGGDQALGAEYVGWAGTVSFIATSCAIFIVTKLSSMLGKRRAFFITIAISIFGYALKWFCFTPDNPILVIIPPIFFSFGLGGLFTLMGSMVADVCDLDELETGERREGMFGSIYWWVVKLGMAAAMAAGGFLLHATGFDVSLGGGQSADTLFYMRLADVLVPVLCSVLAIWMVATYPITEQMAHDVRQKLEQRRGKMAVEDDSASEGNAEVATSS